VLVSGSGTNLQKLLDAQAQGALAPAEIALVVSNRKAAFALERAKAAGVESAVLSKAMEPDPALWDEKLLALLQAHRIDLVVLAGFLMVLGERTLAAFTSRIVNIHPALIPSFAGPGFYGLRVHEAALARGVKITGATAHLVNGEVDGGPILIQKAVEVLPGDTPESLQRRVMEQAEWIILPKSVQLLAERIEAEERA
jgi:phosphoribosylglycinamide formyltransferase-1